MSSIYMFAGAAMPWIALGLLLAVFCVRASSGKMTQKKNDDIDYIGAFYDQKLIGLIGIRTELEHICFFFVDGQYHRKGVGTKMFDYLLENYKGNIITVNSSPYGLGFYKKLGFVPTEEEKTINGI